jgi:hypothetical protein
MGILTDDMTRLRDEIVASREARNAFLTDTEDTVSQMRSRFREAQAEMASKTKAERSAFVADLQANVGELQEAVRSAHAEMANELREGLAANREAVSANEAARQGQAADDRAGRLASVADRNRQVAGRLAEFAADLEGARRAWLGPRRATTTTTERTPRAAGRKSKTKARARAR